MEITHTPLTTSEMDGKFGRSCPMGSGAITWESTVPAGKYGKSKMGKTSQPETSHPEHSQ